MQAKDSPKQIPATEKSEPVSYPKLCLKCGKLPSEIHPTLGVIYCKPCRAQQRGKDITNPFEFVPQSIKDDRVKNAKDIVQSGRDGVLSKEFIELYGTDHLNVTQEQIDNAEYVWSGDTSISAYRRENGKNL